MNRFFDDLGGRWTAAAARRHAVIEAPALTPGLAAELLELARVTAHAQERQFAPLACFTAGVAAERQARGSPHLDEAALIAYIREVRDELEEDSGAPNRSGAE